MSAMVDQDHRSHEDGSSLIEMIIVLAILSSTAFLVGPYVGIGRETRSLNRYAEEIAMMAKTSRAYAIGDNVEREIVFDVEGRRLFMSQSSSELTIPDDMAIAIENTRMPVSPDRPAIRFLPNGTTTGGTLTLVRNEQRAIVRIDWLGGAIKIERTP